MLHLMFGLYDVFNYFCVRNETNLEIEGVYNACLVSLHKCVSNAKRKQR